MNEILIGGIATASFIAGLFFLVIHQWAGPDEASPVYYLPRLLGYLLIIVAIVDKNRRRP